MRLHLAVVATLLLAPSITLAQSTPAPQPPDQQGDRPSPMSDRDEDGGHDGMHHHRGPPTKAARFRIEAGDLSIGMKCPEEENLKACADFTLQLIDKLGSLPRR